MKITIEITPEEFKELVGENNTGTLKGMSLKEATMKMQDDEIKNKAHRYYSEKLNPGLKIVGDIQIKQGDRCRIAPSENCVTNADKIQYDERIDGLECTVQMIEHDGVLVRSALNHFRVEPSWLIKL